MFMPKKALLMAQPESKLYIEDVFATALYTGNGSTQTVNTGVDLVGAGDSTLLQGGLVWLKSRTSTSSNTLVYGTSGATPAGSLFTDLTNAALGGTAHISSFNPSGFSLGGPVNNLNNDRYVAHTFRRAKKFFDCGTYAGNGSGALTVPHQLGVTPGLVIIKRDGAVSNWYAIIRTADNVHAMSNHALAPFGLGTTINPYIGSTGALTTTTFRPAYIGDYEGYINGASYVWFAFAHDFSPDGLVQCVGFTTDASGKATVSLGWEPCWGIFRAVSSTGDWIILDQTRGWNLSASDATLRTNTNGVETTDTERGEPTATGFVFQGAANATYACCCIRRGPMRQPTSGAQVFQEAGYSENSAAPVFVSGFPVDLSIGKGKTTGAGTTLSSRLTGENVLNTTSTMVESGDAFAKFDYMNGWHTAATYPVNGSRIEWMFRRYPGVFDQVYYDGTGGSHTVNHNLSVPPELAIVKSRNYGAVWNGWSVWVKLSTGLWALFNGWTSGLNSTAGAETMSGNVLVTASTIDVATGYGYPNDSGGKYLMLLFATCPGVSKVGSYTGNGGSQTVTCGFTTGARFVLIKRADAAGDWYVWDSARGIVAANDPHLSLNSTAAEVATDDSIDPDNTGFVVNQNAATNINVSGGTYLFLTFA